MNLRFEILDWKHPRQTWALFAAPGFNSTWFKDRPLTWNAGAGKSAQPKESAVTDEKIFATPRKVEDVADCYFYHTMELPGRGVIEGRDWDLRGRVDEYLGNVDFAGQRVLEIGPASGFLTFEMEKRGADVISVEVTDEHGWDFVPYPACKIGRSVRSASNRDATAEEFLLVQSRRPAIQSQSVLWRCLQFACGARRIRHRRDGSSAAPLPRPAPDR